MGLDMYLEARVFVAGYDHDKPEDIARFNTLVDVAGLRSEGLGSPHAVVAVNVAYWRKANQIHKWFVTNVQNGEDNCNPHYVQRDKLAELKELCEKVLDDHSLAGELLPASSGFFFGSTDYDEWYFEDLEYTVSKISHLLTSPSFERADFFYDSSW